MHSSRAATRPRWPRRRTEDQAQLPLVATGNRDTRRPSMSVPRTTRRQNFDLPNRKQPVTGRSPGRRKQRRSCGQPVKPKGSVTAVHRASRSEPLRHGALRSGGVPPLLCRQPRRGFCGGLPEEARSYGGTRVRHNPSLNHRTRYGGLSWPGLRYAVHFPSPGQAIPPHRAG